jgi:predicted nucleic acid-binding protein
VRAELLRAVRRVDPALSVAARNVLEAVTLTEVTTEVFEAAGRIDPTILRTLDAIHVAAALDLGDDLDGMVTYNERLAHAATMNGIRVTAP